MNSKRDCRPGTIVWAGSLAVAFTLTAGGAGFCSERFLVRNQEFFLSDVPALLQSEELWTKIQEPGCRDAHKDAFTKPEQLPARKRLEGLLQYELCVSALKSTVAAQVGTYELPAVTAAFAGAEAEIAEVKMLTTPQTEFMGIRLGAGVGVSYSQDEIVPEAQISAGNIVSATKTETQQPRVILESHYYGFCGSGACNAGRFGVGPFFGIVAKDDKLISAFGAGVMFGWRDSRPATAQGFSVGIGALLDAKVKSLAPGFEDGKALPPGETSIRYQEKSRWSALLIFTRSF